MSVSSIPTVYAGINFRSRLEARWAAFFDACNWPWQYEPVDLSGWIPDFSLGCTPTLVEVKPFFTPEQFADTLTKIKASGYRKSVILLGVGLQNYSDSKNLFIGWLAQGGDDDTRYTLEYMFDLHIGYTQTNGLLGLCPMEGAWSNYIWDAHGKPARVWNNPYDTAHMALAHKTYLRKLTDAPYAHEIVKSNWAKACNRTQWKNVISDVQPHP